MAGIIGYGIYIPRYRLKQADAAMAWSGWAGGEKAVCGADEDIVTMATEASEKAIKHSGLNPAQIGCIYMATDSSPYIEQSVAPILAETLELAPQASMIEFCGSTNSTANALLACLDAIKSGRIEYGLVIGSENRATGLGTEGETAFGAGAAAFVLGAQGTIVDINDMNTYSSVFTDRWRAGKDTWVSNYFDYRFDREYGYEKHIVSAATGLMEKLGEKADDYAYVVLQQPDDRLPGYVVKALGINRDRMAPPIASTIGDLGCSSAFISLAAILDKATPGQKVLLGTYGSGNSTAVSMTVTAQIESRKKDLGPTLETYVARKDYIDYLTYLKSSQALKRAPY